MMNGKADALTDWAQLNAYEARNAIWLRDPISMVESWAIDTDGKIGHCCANSKHGLVHGKTIRLFSPISGVKERSCLRCGDVCSDEVEMLSQLRRLGGGGKNVEDEEWSF